MVSPISLANMEYALYGNTSCLGSLTAPSMVNNYCTVSPYANSFNPYLMNPYMPSMYNPAVMNPQAISAQQAITQQASQGDIDKIANYYEKASENSETLMGAAIGGAAFGLFNNPRLIAHPFNSIKSLGKVEEMFKDIKVAGKNAHKLWNNPETQELMREAYSMMHKIESRNNKKLGWVRQSYIKNPEDYKALEPWIKQLKEGINSGDAKQVENAVAHLKAGYTNNGIISKAMGSVKRFLGFSTKPNTVSEALKNEEIVKGAKAEIAQKVGKPSFMKALKRGGGVKGGIFFMGIELLMAIPNIKAAFSKDNKTGWKQVGQSTVKGAGNAISWAAGEALGVWGATKLCAAAGSAIAPGVGTVIGAVAGLISGSIACWLTGKATNKLVGKDVGEKVKLEQMKKSPEGQVQLLQLTAQNKNIPADVQQSMMNVANQYGMVA